MTIKDYGDQAILIEFEAIIDPAIHQQVSQLHKALTSQKHTGIRSCIPAYHSLTVCYAPALIPKKKLTDLIHFLFKESTSIDHPTSTLSIPVCYEAPFALDMEFVLQQTQLSKKALIQWHTQTIYQVYLLGFLPGFAYLGRVPEQLFCPRKSHPRLKVPKGAVGLAGYQTGIYPSASPGGWQIIGQTPISVFDIQLEQTFLFEVGNQVQFKAIDKSEFEAIKNNPQRWQFHTS